MISPAVGYQFVNRGHNRETVVRPDADSEVGELKVLYNAPPDVQRLQRWKSVDVTYPRVRCATLGFGV